MPNISHHKVNRNFNQKWKTLLVTYESVSSIFFFFNLCFLSFSCRGLECKSFRSSGTTTALTSKEMDWIYVALIWSKHFYTTSQIHLFTHIFFCHSFIWTGFLWSMPSSFTADTRTQMKEMEGWIGKCVVQFLGWKTPNWSWSNHYFL